MTAKLRAAFLDFATMGPGIDTRSLDDLVDIDYYPNSAPNEIVQRLAGRDVAIVNKAKLSAEIIAGLPELRLIALSATGTDNVDIDAARRHGVAVANIRGYCSASVAQHVFALILGLTQQIRLYDGLVRRGAWQSSRTFALFDYPIRELNGLTLGIVGYGALGRSVAALGRCLGMKLLVAARPRRSPLESLPTGRVTLGTVIEESDVLSLHCPLTRDTHHMIGAAELKRMKPDAVLINTARGALVDGAALAAALRTHEIAGAGIDVLPVEPPPDDHPLLAEDVPNLIVTPHIAWAAREARQRAIDQVAENIAEFVAGGRARRIV